MTDARQAALEFLYDRLNYERLGMPRPSELGLGRMRRLLRRLGDPQHQLGIVHVAGTKGKGSTSMLLAAALTASGRRTGLFCSPHLHRLEERFRIDGVDATSAQLVELVEAVKPAVTEFDAVSDREGRCRPTFFEVTTAMGLLHCVRQGAELLVLEVGMGGRLDSTNVVRPLVSVLTTISFDHTRQLGNTLEAIAREKAGIIKRGRPVVSGVLGREPAAAIRSIAARRRSPLRAIDTDFHYRYEPPIPPLDGPTPGAVHVRTWRNDWCSRPVPLLGPHQAQNAAVALAALDVLAEQGLDVPDSAVARGWTGLTFPARCEILPGRPRILVDGAHNAASAEALAETLRACFPPGPRTLVFGTTREKDLPGQLQALMPLFERFVATCYLENPRAVPPVEIAAAMAAWTDRPIAVTNRPAEALDEARRSTPTDGLICVTGSLFLAAETRAYLLGHERPAPTAAVAT